MRFRHIRIIAWIRVEQLQRLLRCPGKEFSEVEPLGTASLENGAQFALRNKRLDVGKAKRRLKETWLVKTKDSLVVAYFSYDYTECKCHSVFGHAPGTVNQYLVAWLDVALIFGPTVIHPNWVCVAPVVGNFSVPDVAVNL